ncbi:MAG: DUF1844 domain-containing protein [Actinobacteria bacterium]|nr:DUF1844 domain-containing protein [Actinomycetota bacterium]
MSDKGEEDEKENTIEEEPVEEGKGPGSSSKLWTPYGDQEAKGGEPPEKGAGEELSEEELREQIEKALEKITVKDVVLDMMISLSSLAYQKMGIPHEVNEKFRDMEQAKLAIDCLDAMVKGLSDRLPEDELKPLSSTIDNLKMNFVKES